MAKFLLMSFFEPFKEQHFRKHQFKEQLHKERFYDGSRIYNQSTS